MAVDLRDESVHGSEIRQNQVVNGRNRTAAPRRLTWSGPWRRAASNGCVANLVCSPGLTPAASMAS